MFVKEIIIYNTTDKRLGVEKNIFLLEPYRIYYKNLEEKNNFSSFTNNKDIIKYQNLTQVKNFIYNYYNYNNYNNYNSKLKLESHIWINLKKPYISLFKFIYQDWRVDLNFYSLGLDLDDKIFKVINKEFTLSKYNRVYKTKKEAYDTVLNFLNKNNSFLQYKEKFESINIIQSN